MRSVVVQFSMVKSVMPVSERGMRSALLQSACLPLAVAMLGSLLLPVNAAEPSRGDEVQSGQIVLLQDVPKRSVMQPAYRGEAVLLDVAPVEEVNAAAEYAGLVEISDENAAVINSGAPTNVLRHDVPLASSNPNTHGGTVAISGSSGMASGVVMRSVGNVTRVTDGLGQRINSVTNQLAIPANIK